MKADDDADDDKKTSTCTDADSLPAAVASQDPSCSSDHNDDTDPQLPTPVTASEPASTGASPTHSDNADDNSNSAVSLDSETNLSTDPVAADI